VKALKEAQSTSSRETESLFANTSSNCMLVYIMSLLMPTVTCLGDCRSPFPLASHSLPFPFLPFHFSSSPFILLLSIIYVPSFTPRLLFFSSLYFPFPRCITTFFLTLLSHFLSYPFIERVWWLWHAAVVIYGRYSEPAGQNLQSWIGSLIEVPDGLRKHCTSERRDGVL